ncbi:DUF5955 family protein [Streptomyces sp. NPDC047928]|uniref:DUF5955 family protein n=1 Tax=unclassified Streptomyces TaxID=2593676 RepID=UPI003711A6DC
MSGNGGAGVDGGADPRVERLGAAVSRLRRELALLRADVKDRGVAEEELAALAAMTAGALAAGGAPPESHRLRRALLLVAGAIGSVSALAAALTEVRDAIDAFGETSRHHPGTPPATPPPRPRTPPPRAPSDGP